MNREASLAMLKDLIEVSRDGARAFALAVRENQEPGVADVLKDAEESCRAAVVDLEEQVQLLDGAGETDGTNQAPVHRGWTSFNAVPISRDTKLILEECERGEDYARNRYEAAMKLELPETARALVQRQHQHVISIQRQLVVLRNRYPATAIPRATASRSDHRHALFRRMETLR
jgi:uncharacterized protein (TIGR02284 family)